MEYYQPIEDYLEKLRTKLSYTEEELENVKIFRESLELMTFDQFTFLFLSGIVKRTAKLKTPRNLYTNGNDIYYLNHRNKRYEKCGYFNSIEE